MARTTIATFTFNGNTVPVSYDYRPADEDCAYYTAAAANPAGLCKWAVFKPYRTTTPKVFFAGRICPGGG